jgi:hypothetical protein
MTPRRSLEHVLQQRRLADPRLTTDNEHSALTVANGLEHSIEEFGFAAPAL